MIIPKATYTISLDTRRKKANGTYPLKVRVFYNNEKVRYSTGLDLSKEDFQKSYIEKSNKIKYKEIRKDISDLTKHLDEILEEMGSFSFEKFEARLLSKSASNDLFAYFEQYIKILQGEDRTRTASSYKQALVSLKANTQRLTLPFELITPRFLKNYERKMVDQGRSTSTVGIYLRYVRNLYNIAIKDGIIHQENYPFGKGKYVIANTPKTYKALMIEDLRKLMNEPCLEEGSEEFFRDLWFFSYFGNGINTKDIALLRYSDIKDNIIHFKRAKTILTKRDAPEGEIPIIEQIQKIIDKWGNPNMNSKNYIFPILVPGMKAEMIDKVVHQTNKQIKKYIQRVATRAGIDPNISMQHARHTFATILVQSNVPLPNISRRLTHGSITTTDKYIGRNSSIQEFEISELLTLKNKP